MPLLRHTVWHGFYKIGGNGHYKMVIWIMEKKYILFVLFLIELNLLKKIAETLV